MWPTVILDTNVLVAGLRSSTGASHALLQAVAEGRLEVSLTTALVLEYEDVLKRPGLVPLPSEAVREYLDELCLVGRLCPVWFRLRPAAADPGDDLVLEAAVAAGACIISLNIRDLREGAQRFGIELLTPGEALQRVGGAE